MQNGRITRTFTRKIRSTIGLIWWLLRRNESLAYFLLACACFLLDLPLMILWREACEDSWGVDEYSSTVGTDPFWLIWGDGWYVALGRTVPLSTSGILHWLMLADWLWLPFPSSQKYNSKSPLTVMLRVDEKCVMRDEKCLMTPVFSYRRQIDRRYCTFVVSFPFDDWRPSSIHRCTIHHHHFYPQKIIPSSAPQQYTHYEIQGCQAFTDPFQ